MSPARFCFSFLDVPKGGDENEREETRKTLLDETDPRTHTHTVCTYSMYGTIVVLLWVTLLCCHSSLTALSLWSR